MFWSNLLLLLNPLLMLFGTGLIAWACVYARTPAAKPPQGPDREDDDDEPGIGIDWDQPLDLPPGVYVPPREPEPMAF